MPNELYTPFVASITDLKKDPMGVLENAEGEAVAILNRNTPVFYCVPADRYAELLNALEDAELREIVKSREGQKRMRIDIDKL